MVDMSAWEVLGVPKKVQRGLSEQSFTTPTPMKNFFFFFFGKREREEKNNFSTCTCIYYDVHLAHLCVTRLSHTL